MRLPDQPTIVVPFRAGSAKSRLPRRARTRLADAMLEDVLAVCREVGEVVVATEPVGLGAAVSAALASVPRGPVLVVNADVPAVTREDLWKLLRGLPDRGLALVEAPDGTTNALALSSATLFQPLYGAASASRFRALADSHTLELPNLARDVDTLDDVVAIEERAGPRTRAMLAQLRGMV